MPVLSERTGVSIGYIFDTFFKQDITFHTPPVAEYRKGKK
jgi:hypothetical protein